MQSTLNFLLNSQLRYFRVNMHYEFVQGELWQNQFKYMAQIEHSDFHGIHTLSLTIYSLLIAWVLCGKQWRCKPRNLASLGFEIKLNKLFDRYWILNFVVLCRDIQDISVIYKNCFVLQTPARICVSVLFYYLIS